MPGKLRVYELAKQLGVTSKELLAALKEQGEFVKTASSTIEPPVVKKMKSYYEAQGGGRAEAPKDASAKAATPTKTAPAKPGPKRAAAKPGPAKPTTAQPAAKQAAKSADAPAEAKPTPKLSLIHI